MLSMITGNIQDPKSHERVQPTVALKRLASYVAAVLITGLYAAFWVSR